jgi:hypothetical protein
MYFSEFRTIKILDLRIYTRTLVGRGWLDLGASCYTGLLLDFLIFSPAFTCVFAFFFFPKLCVCVLDDQ